MTDADLPIPAPRRAVIARDLLAWYRRHARDLPWRRTGDPYAIWISEVMLQQTRVETVIPYYRRWLAALPTVEALAAADEETVLKLWEGLGYYRRARFLHRAARVVVDELGGRLPTSAEGWRALPGVGPYTAGAVASIAHGERAAVVDGNVKRVLARLAAIDRPIDTTAVTTGLWDLADALVPADAPGDFNQALMELGARICLPRSPRCLLCPLAGDCAARAAGRQGELPVRRPKKPVPHATVVAARIADGDGRWLLGKRPPGGLLGGLWEFPGGKVEDGETPAEALARELREELGTAADVGAELASVEHAYTHLRITITLFDAHLGGPPEARAHDALVWVAPDELDAYALPKATHKLLARILD